MMFKEINNINLHYKKKFNCNKFSCIFEYFLIYLFYTIQIFNKYVGKITRIKWDYL